MTERTFVAPTKQEVEERKKMYAEAEEMGIDLMSFDAEKESSADKKDIRKAVVLLGRGLEVPRELKERLLRKKQTAQIAK